MKKKGGNGKGKIDPSQISFSVIKQRGSPTTATTLEGYKVEKLKYIYCENPFDPHEVGDPEKEMIQVLCIDYHNEQFVYMNPDNRRGTWFAYCTCGSPAVIIDNDPYKTEENFHQLACFFHMQFGRHVVSSERKWS
jgi:hypothetical protein